MEQGYLVSLVLFVIASFTIQTTRSELFTAIVDLERILWAENSVASDLREYIALEEKRLQKLKELANDYEQHSADALANPEKHFANPVNAFLLVKRFTTDWDHVIDTLVQNNTSQDFLNRVESHTSYFPSEDDLEGAATALLRLQDTYALPTEKIAKGDLHGVDTSTELSAHDCFELGRISYNQGDWYHAIKWLGQAMDIIDRETDVTLDRATLLDYYSYATYMQGNLQHAKNLTIEWLQLEPNHQRAQNNLNYYNQMLQQRAVEQGKGEEEEPEKEEFQNKRIMDEYRQSQEFADYEALCRGEDIKPNPDAHKLTCQYRRHHPMFYIDPLKEETMFLKPWLVVYHDVISEKEMAVVKELALPKLHRSGVFRKDKSNAPTPNYRISKSAWIVDEENATISRISQRCMAMTNLTLWSVEPLQVVNYGIGGHYEPHFDFARPEEKGTFEEWRGNRILTVIFYISEVLSGGRTVFPQAGFGVPPVKGGAAVWYNMLANGEGDYSTRHAGCPVLTGQKWVCNKWFHERGQEFTRKCDPDPAL